MVPKRPIKTLEKFDVANKDTNKIITALIKVIGVRLRVKQFKLLQRERETRAEIGHKLDLQAIPNNELYSPKDTCYLLEVEASTFCYACDCDIGANTYFLDQMVFFLC